MVLVGCGRVAFDPMADSASDLPDAVPANLVLDFELDADLLHDSGPGQHDATCTTCPTAVVDATRGMVGMFDGTQCLRVADAPSLRPTQLTVTVWAAWVGGITEVFSRPLNGDTNVSNTYELYIAPGGVVFYVNSQARVGNPPPPNEWHHFAGVYDGVSNVLYIDGVDVTGPRTVGAMTYGNDAIYIGCEYDVGVEVQGFNGKLDAVRLYDVALAPSEIVADMNR